MQERQVIELLIIEDNPGDARLAQEMLSEATEASFICTIAKSLKEGLWLLERRRFAVLLLDLSLPDSSGTKGVRSVRREFPKVPIVVLTGLNDRQLASEALQVGAEDYLVKGHSTADAMARSILYSIDRHKAEEMLRAAKEKAELASRAKTEFLATMSHELRTPLNAIIGFSEVLLSEALGPLGHDRYKEYVSDIRSSGTHFLALVDEILDISRIECGRIELEESAIDLAELIDFCLAPFEETIAAKGLDLSIRANGRASRVYGDRRMFKKILINLLSNAVKFTPAGGKIDLRADLDERGRFAISLVDTGIGIDKKDVDRILQPFERGETAFSRTHDGAGMGLALAKSLIEVHGGDLEIDSQPGRGTRVVLHLPRDRVVRETAVVHREVVEGPAE